MDTLLYWLDRGDWLAQLQHAWIWASLTTILTIATIVGIVLICRHYDAVERRFEQPRAQV